MFRCLSFRGEQIRLPRQVAPRGRPRYAQRGGLKRRFRVSFPFPPLQDRKDHIHGAACIALVSVNILFPVMQSHDFPQFASAIVGWVNIIGNVSGCCRPAHIGDFPLCSGECAERQLVRDFSRPWGDECFHLFDWLLIVEVECSHGLDFRGVVVYKPLIRFRFAQLFRKRGGEVAGIQSANQPIAS